MLGSRILLIVGGGIAAFKVPELIRMLRREGASVVPVLTEAGAQFVTPLTLSALAEAPCHSALFDLTRESEMGHIQLSRAADLVVVAPATADLMARMAAGMANDLASTLLLATDKPVLIAPAMNVRMWQHPATQRNLELLEADGISLVGPDEGDMACGEYGPGRMAEPDVILQAIRAALGKTGPLRLPPEAAVLPPRRLSGRHVIVTSGPTHEPIDPVRYIANRSSGAQGTAIAEALRDLGAQVTFVTGPAEVPPPTGVDVVAVETARQMHEAVERALPADAAVMAAAVADWHVANARSGKIKKDGHGSLPQLQFAENPDILAWISQLDHGRPDLVVGFAAETDDVIANATRKRLRKGCDWIVANDVSPATGIMGGSENAITLITPDGSESWPRLGKSEVARRLADRIAQALAPGDEDDA
ncbi:MULTISPECIES: bifunctional phosphopantothenoylcysteine decarboxylase/phosphopantothenate--cysteine ligase CoaBC [unclassified Paracoccus (in: a-proteobacteria)]|uniref:bifunctional phosphopantothenoylcysteine decarboxylase/phosphopantothenate--cysteine ligase CoaBC n=1 Tax=unclassified Paracoccus (in: a-proteobacteria) TaxID=2688777 RepID=UPI0021E11B20|nr:MULTISPECIES: bifunctional phosphopantothenoylcysteine decarboxylase/phosphopantothenate--cysteine ligase CoaBC [unclassified Paracoccus (in: a-proteobacteria)]UXU74085.1 bifunctional phosphopantothenoylcysteine decarboxylase/phosphopantothenate--cysteine ligase CoaBC [Paracoccus sp. SMMA_5]UXU79975.1 bifunctional phosphopantothenoylcysteine decarboxylase/phosphopantothenate--cysteine ligase CoaBC [Paracoccus sp. SMMA_5_TC]